MMRFISKRLFWAIPTLLIVKIMNDHTDREAQESVQLTHPLGVALGKIIIDRDHVHAASTERVQINWEGGDQRFTFAGLHFSNLALVQNHATDQLHVEMPHVQHTASCLAHNRERLFENLVKDLVCSLQSLGVEFALPVEIRIGLVGNLG